MSTYREIGTFFNYEHQAKTILAGNCLACHGSGEVHDHSGPNGDSVGMMRCYECKGSGKHATPEEIAKAKETMKMLEEGVCLYCQFPVADHPPGRSSSSPQDCLWAVVKIVHRLLEAK